ncbi:phage terminase small subunit P27 family [Shinella zoogloeoides]|uniref:phage terminase small subunit P27 family n=1 Tax=Shinella zoogloeoides TaxID=352475 RepID=UPI001F5677C7|nr:phage terminase small subunit P27 family [Shinella zoogloeoides]
MKGRKAAVTVTDGALKKVPPAPKDLSPLAQAVWRRELAPLVRAEKIAAHELPLFKSYCSATARIDEAQAEILKHGLLIVGASGELKRNPATTIQKEAIALQARLATEFGISPASRNKNEGFHDRSEDAPPGVDI